MKIVVFGGAGWLGRATLANLEAHGHQVRAFDHTQQAWAAWEDVDGPWQGERIYGDIANYSEVEAAVAGCDAVVHVAVWFPKGGEQDRTDERAFLVNLKGLWNVLEVSRNAGVRRVVHIGSCQTIHPQGVFFSADVRRPDGSLYAVTKRLQEEMCRQYWDAFQLPLIVLRPDYIVDTRIGLGRQKEKLGPQGHRAGAGWVCRHDLAEACRLSVEAGSDIGFDIFHIVGTTEAADTCNVGRSRTVLGLQYRGDIEQYR
ncbi:MAG: NAD(P)-dependent oxidoreductase [bacterium]|nr:NAD(P)-dependent oxidoreductase [bacterium]